MAIEIERKFLVSGKAPLNDGVKMVQAYLCDDRERTVRVRTEGDRAVFTIKGATVGFSRSEFEYEIPMADAGELMGLALSSRVEKTRYYERVGEHTWEIDVFKGANKGLVIAEIELSAEDEIFVKPEWLGQEVSEDRRYSNSALARRPYSEW